MHNGGRGGRRAKIVATLGPASGEEITINALIAAGVDVFRINLSHGDHAQHAAHIASIRRQEARARRPIAILADVQGPKLRIGALRGGHVTLTPGRRLRLDLLAAPGDGERLPLPHPEIIAAAGPGDVLLLDDGKLRLEVMHRQVDHLETKVLVGGRLAERKGVNVPGASLPIAALTEKDRRDIGFVLDQGVDYIGLSFVQRAQDVVEARELVGGRAAILSKIEKPQALSSLEEIIRLSDAVMVARGDLGVELPPEDVPLAQKRIIRAARRWGRPVIVATQMLESMIDAPTPTRAEASDVATAILDGADAAMLSAETAVGRYPLEAVAIMERIIRRAEQDEISRQANADQRPAPERSSADALASAARQVAQTIGARAIAAFSHSGATALRIARERPDCPIVGLTPAQPVARRLALAWGIHPLPTEPTVSMTETVHRAVTLTRREGLAEYGDEIVVVAGVPFGLSGEPIRYELRGLRLSVCHPLRPRQQIRQFEPLGVRANPSATAPNAPGVWAPGAGRRVSASGGDWQRHTKRSGNLGMTRVIGLLAQPMAPDRRTAIRRQDPTALQRNRPAPSTSAIPPS